MPTKYQQELKQELEKHLGRQASDDEVINAENDVNLLMKIVLRRLEIIEKQLKIQ